ncbi:unnamed protein product [Arabis nemorensis]|uniref:Uncharacterized protein n=1 Tax=Arabis nemorensis TaxID=586526 RepID=A0A565AYD3_9BRAS|nr:unnamed protein product [Arabis nemorensis]
MKRNGKEERLEHQQEKKQSKEKIPPTVTLKSPTTGEGNSKIEKMRLGRTTGKKEAAQNLFTDYRL